MVFFYTAKLIWFFLQPSNAINIFFILGFICFLLHKNRPGAAFLATGAAVYVIAGFSPISMALILPLEQRYGRADAAEVSPTGVIVLGGAINSVVSAARDSTTLTDSGQRLTEAVRLSRLYPKARIVFSGGDWLPSSTANAEASTAQKFFIEMGVSPERITLENRSRNTYENAVFTTAVLKPKVGEQWLLVTSAFHMPRAVGCFRAAGFDVTPWPVDYRTSGWKDLRSIFTQPSDGLRQLDLALKEWLGLLAYRLSGRTDQLLP
jgi:uncharacterized SAM-binding protein YcdF (DUF218 family)